MWGPPSLGLNRVGRGGRTPGWGSARAVRGADAQRSVRRLRSHAGVRGRWAGRWCRRGGRGPDRWVQEAEPARAWLTSWDGERTTKVAPRFWLKWLGRWRVILCAWREGEELVLCRLSLVLPGASQGACPPASGSLCPALAWEFLICVEACLSHQTLPWKGRELLLNECKSFQFCFFQLVFLDGCESLPSLQPSWSLGLCM